MRPKAWDQSRTCMDSRARGYMRVGVCLYIYICTYRDMYTYCNTGKPCGPAPLRPCAPPPRRSRSAPTSSRAEKLQPQHACVSGAWPWPVYPRACSLSGRRPNGGHSGRSLRRQRSPRAADLGKAAVAAKTVIGGADPSVLAFLHRFLARLLHLLAPRAGLRCASAARSGAGEQSWKPRSYESTEQARQKCTCNRRQQRSRQQSSGARRRHVARTSPPKAEAKTAASRHVASTRHRRASACEAGLQRTSRARRGSETPQTCKRPFFFLSAAGVVCRVQRQRLFGPRLLAAPVCAAKASSGFVGRGPRLLVALICGQSRRCRRP